MNVRKLRLFPRNPLRGDRLAKGVRGDLLMRRSRGRCKTGLLFLAAMAVWGSGAQPAPAQINQPKIVKIEAEGQQTLALREDGTVVSWGPNSPEFSGLRSSEPVPELHYFSKVTTIESSDNMSTES